VGFVAPLTEFEIDTSTPTDMVRINFNPAPQKRSRSFRLSPQRHEGPYLEVRYAPSEQGIGPPRDVRLMHPDGVHAADLRRFAWSRWLQVADAHMRLRNNFSIDALGAAQRAGEAVAKAAGKPVTPRRPGRKGHPDSHYQWVADRYQELVLSGSRNPVTTIATEKQHSRSAAAAWVATCRKRNLLGPAERGRAV
jgi:hypothetical protein